MNPSLHFHASDKADKSASHSRWIQAKQGSERYQPQIDSDSTAFYTLDAEGFITFYSKLAVAIWGRTPDVGDTYERFVSPYIQYRQKDHYLPRGQSPMNEVLGGKIPGVFNAEVHIYRPDGSYVPAIVNIAPLVDDSGKIVGAVKSFCQNPLHKT